MPFIKVALVGPSLISTLVELVLIYANKTISTLVARKASARSAQEHILKIEERSVIFLQSFLLKGTCQWSGKN